MFTLLVDSNNTYLDSAARIWAAATSARDREDAIPPLEQSRPIIQSATAGTKEGILLIALHADEVVGFAALAPRIQIEPSSHSIELHYLGVCPRWWGRGAARALLDGILPLLGARGYSSAHLQVYCDNLRAISLYKAAGWQPEGGPSRHPRTGKFEQRYRISITGDSKSL
ncbi:Acetyltransferase (GNAT) family protein [compost metagenome]|uniref:GNAT family N-acetyltransferase n=1 Tax=Variovorax boronicumulans TaxID=436515 RepID=UPI000BB33D29